MESQNGSIYADRSDDGVSFSKIQLGEPFVATVTVFNDTGEDAMLVGYVDLNGDGMWSADEEVREPVSSSDQPQTVILTFGVVTDATDLYGRFRLTSDMGVTATGNAPDGEVEDYLFASPTAVTLSNGHSTSNPVLFLLVVVMVGVATIAAVRRRYS